MFLFFTVQLVFYSPSQWLLNRVASVVCIPAGTIGDTIFRGDGLLVEGNWLRPDSFSRGDLVTYHINPVADNGLVVQPGTGLDRIVGLPGDTIELDKGILKVNGADLREDELPLGRIPAFSNNNF